MSGNKCEASPLEEAPAQTIKVCTHKYGLVLCTNTHPLLS